MKYIRFFETEAEMTAFLNTHPEYCVLCGNAENDKICILEGEPTSPYVAVDLGLASGTKWANMNVGATKETEAGLYFAWGDTEGFAASEVSGKFTSSWYSSRPGASLTSSITPDGGHDAARVNMGGTWRMPTRTEITELVDYGNRTWTTIDGVNGYKITNKTDSSKYIFLSAAGFGYNGSVNDVGYGYYWSSSLGSSYSYGLVFLSGNFVVLSIRNGRYSGFSVRGVQ